MKSKVAFIFIIIGLFFSCCSQSNYSNYHKVENLEAFAKLYGYVRYFHPSDEADSVNWDKFLYYGIIEVSDLKTKAELENKLKELFKPIAPSMKINGHKLTNNLTPEESDSLILVSWQHRGIGLYEGSYYKSIRIGRTDITNDSLFEKSASKDDVVITNICKGIQCEIPLSLFLNKEKPTNYSSDFNDLSVILDSIQLEDSTAYKEPTRFGAVVKSWSIFRHFYPYFDVVETNWDSVLTQTLIGVTKDKNSEECILTLRKMTSELYDGHAAVGHVMNKSKRLLPVLFDYIDNKIVVVKSNDTQLLPGDILINIDGELAMQQFKRQYDIASGTPQWKKIRAFKSFTAADSNHISQLTIDRDGKELNFKINRNKPRPNFCNTDTIQKLKDEIYYVNLCKVGIEEIEQKINMLAESKGVIFDLRGYPNYNHDVISYLIESDVKSARWFVPEIIHPDYENISGFDTSGRWTIEPKEPHIKGKVVFLIDGNAISYAESFLGIIENYNLGVLVGSNTAGANGDINYFHTMGGFVFVWTGSKVLKHNYEQFHLIGVKPTIVINPTLDGIKKQKDEILEMGIRFINNET